MQDEFDFLPFLDGTKGTEEEPAKKKVEKKPEKHYININPEFDLALLVSEAETVQKDFMDPGRRRAVNSALTKMQYTIYRLQNLLKEEN